MNATLQQLLARRLPRNHDDRGSLAMAMMAILVGATLGALIVPIVIAQNKSTRFDITRVHSLHAAQTGVDVMLGRIRASTKLEDGNPTGNPVSLPCSTVTGATQEGTGRGTFSVSVTYWATVPPDQGTKRAAGDPAPAAMICSSGYGTYDPVTQTATPRYAVVTSTGKDGTVDSGSQGRTLVSTYVFQTDDTNISGGLFRLFPASGSTQNLCMQAEDAAPVAGTRIVLRACSGTVPPLATQVFAYRSDLSIQLVSSAKTAPGLCIDTKRTGTEPGAHVDGVGIVLQTCAIASPAKCADITRCSPWNQQWSVDNDAHLRDARTDQSDIGGKCIHAAAQADGTPLTLQTCDGSTKDPEQTWIPSPNAGAGMAGAANNQLVNYRQFATCLDVTDQKPEVSVYLILYTCKQNPDPSNVAFNQKFVPSPATTAKPTNVLLKSTKGLIAYCLLSPRSAGGLVRVAATCPIDASTSTAYRWTINQTEDASGNELPYSMKFTIVDSSGLCLALGPNSDQYLEQYLKAIVATCDGSTGQKWNATASLDRSKLIATHESTTP